MHRRSTGKHEVENACEVGDGADNQSSAGHFLSRLACNGNSALHPNRHEKQYGEKRATCEPAERDVGRLVARNQHAAIESHAAAGFNKAGEDESESED